MSKNTEIIKPEIDPRIFAIKDQYGFNFTMRPAPDTPTKSAGQIIEEMGENACQGRVSIFKNTGLKPMNLTTTQCVVVSNRVVRIICNISFIDYDTKRFAAAISQQDKEMLKDMGKLIKVFTN